MATRIFLCIGFLMATVLVSAQEKRKPVNIIFDSDMGPDYDDVGAITLLHAFGDSGYVNILATIASTKYEGVAAVFNVLNTYFNRPNLLIGVPKGKALELKDWQHWTDSLQLKYPHTIKTNDEVPGATEVYRKVLASQPDSSVTIVTTGFLTNLADLLRSGPDQYTDLNGRELVANKVKHLVCMAGGFPSFNEFNVKMDAVSSKFVFENWTTPIIFSGWEIGYKIRSGLPLIKNDVIRNSPVKDVYRISIPMDNQDSLGRMSWDQTAVVVAVMGCKPWWSCNTGKITIADNGTNGWMNGPFSHSYLIEEMPASVIEHLINKWMMHQPMNATRAKN